MKVTGVDVCPLTGATVDGGWPQGHEPQENLHTLVIVHTDQGLQGFGRKVVSRGQNRFGFGVFCRSSHVEPYCQW